MKSWLWLLAIPVMGIPISMWRHESSSLAGDGPWIVPVPHGTPVKLCLFMGAGSVLPPPAIMPISVTAPRGENTASGSRRDHHAKAYEVLFAHAP